jgi:ABC-type dipeptide/oligopeptide/nickel transport system permease subunit
MIGLGIFLFICLACALLPGIIRWDYYEPDFNASLKTPSLEHIFGTNQLGRDMLSGVLYGGRTTLRIAAVSTFIAMIAGSAIGLIAGYYGGRADFIISRATDMLSSVPVILLTLFIEFTLGWGRGYFVYAMAISATPQFARLVRASVLTIMGQEYIEAARALGDSHIGIIMRHVLRNVAIPIIIHLTGCFSEAILTCTILGYLGVGISPPAAEWGVLVYRGKAHMLSNPHVILFPSFAVTASVISLNFFGNGLRDAFDPKEGA